MASGSAPSCLRRQHFREKTAERDRFLADVESASVLDADTTRFKKADKAVSDEACGDYADRLSVL